MMIAMAAPALAIQTEEHWSGLDRSWVGRVDQNHLNCYPCLDVERLSFIIKEDDEGYDIACVGWGVASG